MDLNQNSSTHQLSNPLTPHDPDEINLLVFGFGMFFMTCLVIVFGQAFSSADKTEEDRTLIEKIKKEMILLSSAGQNKK